jgi:hypothetical protein
MTPPPVSEVATPGSGCGQIGTDIGLYSNVGSRSVTGREGFYWRMSPPVEVQHSVLYQPLTVLPYHFVHVAQTCDLQRIGALWAGIGDGVCLHLGRVSMELDFLVSHEMGGTVGAVMQARGG